ncbi:MAG TPA: undecaprenyl-diphosphate phosphatase [bacterium]|nr:undecaprenyl-diphosphate phosphatase [bacterium]
MELLHAAVKGIIQGLTEFFPVSSHAHLTLYPLFAGEESPFLNSLAFDVAIHGGTLLSLIVFFRKKILSLIKGFFGGIKDAGKRGETDFKLSLYIIAATVPAVIGGLMLEGIVEEKLRAPAVIGFSLIVFGAVLFVADRTGKKEKVMGNMSLRDALIIGFAQVLAFIPGVSRSGITISAALLTGYKREDAAEFSFIMSIPAVTGALVLKFRDLYSISGSEAVLTFAGFMTAMISGYFAIKFLLVLVKKHSYMPFIVYRLILGIVVLAVLVKW